jgi:glycosyltransferase 2 family protein
LTSLAPEPVAAPSASALTRGLARKLIVGAVFGALVVAGLMVYSDVGKLLQVAQSFAPSAVALGFTLAAGNYALRIVRWHYYLSCIGVSVPVGESAVVFLSGFVMSVTPGKVGEVFKSVLLYESRGVSIVRTAPIVVAERLTDLIALVMLTALGSLTFEHGPAIAATGALLVAGLFAVCAYRPLGELLLRIAEKLPLISKISHRLREAYDSLLTMLRPAPLFFGTLIALMAWGLECAALYVIVAGFPGTHLAWDSAVFAYSASTIAGAVAMMPGGLGVTEGSMTGLLQALGGGAITRTVATAATILVRIATLWFAVLIGLAAFGVYKLMRRRSAA